MGYITSFNGKIKIKSTECKLYIKNYLLGKDDEDSDFKLNDSRFDEGQSILFIDEEWKNYDDNLQFILFKIARLDCEAKGEIEASGEEQGDFWKIIIEKGRIFEQKGEIVYKDKKEWKTKFDEDDLNELHSIITPYKSLIYCDKCKKELDLSKFDFRNRGYYDLIISSTKLRMLCQSCYKNIKQSFIKKQEIESNLIEINKSIEEFK